MIDDCCEAATGADSQLLVLHVDVNDESSNDGDQRDEWEL
jgi:hypothetical protein